MNESHSDCEHTKVESIEVADAALCERAAAIFRALGEPNRLKLLCLLANRELCVSELTQILKDNVPAVSQRLKLLKSERLVKQRRQGKHIFYRLADAHIQHLIENGLAHGSEPTLESTEE
ncbi:hypothetical protein VN12_26030 [Pirellula sp. SH-Sr6A]|uniref:ArsR/SmtB family transcription factor n=1 Tax=Pirellula sp. SH-Sr6A TaxID=1632865 RepID=UPI00078E14B2|nr:metalloregulator ArsR/SmtB family transcription factor [Pirellula sp. SH-Sr6A]AMV35578.1 hypothetical protein VN12_26030 [Pirellula sp. SH-Sr6A]